MNMPLTLNRRRAVRILLYTLTVTGFYTLFTCRGAAMGSTLLTVNALPYITAAIGFFEGPYMAGCLGAYGGLLMSLSSSTAEGAEALIMGLFGVFCGAVAMTFMRRMTASVLVCGSALLAGRGLISATYYSIFYSVPFLHVFVDYAKIILVSLLPGAVGYLIVSAVSRRFREEE